MKFQILAATFAACAAAAPHMQYRQTNGTSTNGTAPIGDNQPFGLVAIRSGSELQYASFSAAQNGLLLDLPAQNATCSSSPAPNYATFYLSEGALYLQTPSNITQELYTDRSGMGQGVLEYSTTPGGYQAGRNSETTGWAIDESGDLTFDGSSFIACSGSIDNSWSVWVEAGNPNPAGLDNCVGIAARTVTATDNVACTYGYTPASS
ncbi:hypothetical protein VPNG_08551 [Cytospora leucostoma]|uniref:Cell wall protein PhiA n=1 Tax=Cytospora leucostoma TaxID=1230097 RepID=A0A423W594_9PEZI|nr:hypothetical protein VPNG_08551 [Cytospora leucostoma]